jgi:hypothetical protein
MTDMTERARDLLENILRNDVKESDGAHWEYPESELQALLEALTPKVVAFAVGQRESQELSKVEARGLAAGLIDYAEGRVKSLDEIEREIGIGECEGGSAIGAKAAQGIAGTQPLSPIKSSLSNEHSPIISPAGAEPSAEQWRKHNGIGKFFHTAERGISAEHPNGTDYISADEFAEAYAAHVTKGMVAELLSVRQLKNKLLKSLSRKHKQQGERAQELDKLKREAAGLREQLERQQECEKAMIESNQCNFERAEAAETQLVTAWEALRDEIESADKSSSKRVVLEAFAGKLAALGPARDKK